MGGSFWLQLKSPKTNILKFSPDEYLPVVPMNLVNIMLCLADKIRRIPLQNLHLHFLI